MNLWFLLRHVIWIKINARVTLAPLKLDTQIYYLTIFQTHFYLHLPPPHLKHKYHAVHFFFHLSWKFIKRAMSIVKFIWSLFFHFSDLMISLVTSQHRLKRITSIWVTFLAAFISESNGFSIKMRPDPLGRTRLDREMLCLTMSFRV